MWLAGKSGKLSESSASGNGSAAMGRAEVSATIAQGARQPQSSQLTVESRPEGVGKVHAMLVIERGNSAGKQFPLSDPNANIGRWDAEGGVFPDVDLDADDPEAKVSRRHALISLRDGQYEIEDLGSTNGTFVNRGRRLNPGDRQTLNDGDEIIVGKTFLRFRVAK